MTRLLGLVSVLAALAIGGWLLTSRLGAGAADAGPVLARTHAAEEVAAVSALLQAALELDAARAAAGTYAGVAPSAQGVRVVRADAASFCLEAGGMHLARPGGVAAHGRC